RLRLKRTGEVLSYLWAAGASDDFHEINRCDFWKDEIREIRLTAANDRSPCKLDVRLIDLRIRSGTRTNDSPAVSAPATKGSAHRLLIALALLLILLLMIGVALALRKGLLGIGHERGG